jgi:MFS family permease
MVIFTKPLVFAVTLDLLVNGIAVNIFGPTLLKIMDSFSIDFAVASLVVSAWAFGCMLCIFTGRMPDKYGAYNMTRLSLLLIGVSYILMGLSTNLLTLFFFSFLGGVANGTFHSSCNQVILGSYSESKGNVLNRTQGFYGIGATIGPTIAAVIISFFNDWKFGFIICGTMLVIAAIPQFLLKSTKKGSTAVSEKSGSSNRSYFVLLAVIMFMIYAMPAGINSWLPTFIVRTGKASYLEAGLILSGIWGAITIGRFSVGRVVDKLGIKKILVYLSLLGGISSLAAIFASGFSSNAILWGLVGLSTAPTYPLILTLVYNRYQKMPGTIIGRISAIGSIGALTAPPAIGMLARAISPEMTTLFVPITFFALILMFNKMEMD